MQVCGIINSTAAKLGMSRMSSGGKYMKFPNKDRLQLGLASPDEDYPDPKSQASGPGACRDWFYTMIFRECSVPGESLQSILRAGAGLSQVPVHSQKCSPSHRTLGPGTVKGRSQNILRAIRIQTRREVAEENSWHSQHSQLAKVEWKNHYWMFSLCHSEEHPWLSHRPSLSTEKQRVCFICLRKCPKAQKFIKLNRKGAGRLQHTELLTVVISE